MTVHAIPPAVPLGNGIVLEFWLETFRTKKSYNGIIPCRIAGNEMTIDVGRV